jgi:glycosyltransferase involved in cell wall biosynthesis
MKSLISIIIPTYNRAHFIAETLDSIIAQTYTNWECIIVDDGSIDNTSEIIRKYIEKDNRFQFYNRPREKLKGPNSCRNYGFDLSTGDYINWFDSDDLYLPNALLTWLNQFTINIDVVVAKLERIDYETKFKINESRILSNTVIEDYFTGKISYYVCGPLWKRSFLEQQTELFDESIGNLDDWDFNLRMLYMDPKIAYFNAPLIQYRIHENSLSNEINKLNFQELMSEFNAREKHLALIKMNKKANLLVLRTFDKERCKYILRAALVLRHSEKAYLYKILLTKQIKVFDIKGIFKTSIGFVAFYLFNRGYSFFK